MDQHKEYQRNITIIHLKTRSITLIHFTNKGFGLTTSVKLPLSPPLSLGVLILKCHLNSSLQIDTKSITIN